MRELKNQKCMRYMAWLTGSYRMRLAALCFLRKSHTHDIIDQLFGIIARRIASTDSLLTPEDVIATITRELSRRSIQDWYTCTLHVAKLDAVRNWDSFLDALRTNYEGGLLEDASANHMFVMVLRKGCQNQSAFISSL